MQQRRTAPATTASSRGPSSGNRRGGSSTGIGSGGRFTLVHGIVLGLILVAIVAFALYVQVLTSITTSHLQGGSGINKESSSSPLRQQLQVTLEPPAQAGLLRKDKKKPADQEVQRKEDGEEPGSDQEESSITKEVLILKTSIGSMRIVLRPDLSKESVDYIHRMVDAGCEQCRLYRAEKPGILQGIIANSHVPKATTRGSCPKGFENVKNECPSWDKSCGCHGPIMTKGMVGWAAGKTGPDFFIDNYKNPGKWWGTQHTIWGEIEDVQTFALIDHIWTLPAKKSGGLTMLNEPIKFTIELLKRH